MKKLACFQPLFLLFFEGINIIAECGQLSCVQFQNLQSLVLLYVHYAFAFDSEIEI